MWQSLETPQFSQEGSRPEPETLKQIRHAGEIVGPPLKSGQAREMAHKTSCRVRDRQYLDRQCAAGVVSASFQDPPFKSEDAVLLPEALRKIAPGMPALIIHGEPALFIFLRLDGYC